jgi:hypothetical protein
MSHKGDSAIVVVVVVNWLAKEKEGIRTEIMMEWKFNLVP